MAKVYQVQLRGNCTEINGTLIRIPPVLTSEAPNNGTSEDAYDHQGAMQFIIATVLVYSICGVLCTLINRMKRLRGKSHEAYLQDENVQRYLKTEKILKYDGRKTKMMNDCEKIVETVKTFEEKQKLREIEREITSGEFAQARDLHEIKKKKTRRKKKRKGRGLGDAVGHMGLSLFYIPQGERGSKNNNNKTEDCGHVTSADEAVPLCSDATQPVFNYFPSSSPDTACAVPYADDTHDDRQSDRTHCPLETNLDNIHADFQYIEA